MLMYITKCESNFLLLNNSVFLTSKYPYQFEYNSISQQKYHRFEFLNLMTKKNLKNIKFSQISVLKNKK